ncbi:dynein heavy chain [Gurleya vavrai]
MFLVEKAINCIKQIKNFDFVILNEKNGDNLPYLDKNFILKSEQEFDSKKENLNINQNYLSKSESDSNTIKFTIYISENYKPNSFYTVQINSDFDYHKELFIEVYKIVKKSYLNHFDKKNEFIKIGKEIIGEYMVETKKLNDEMNLRKYEIDKLVKETEDQVKNIKKESDLLTKGLNSIQNEKENLELEINNCNTSKKIIENKLDNILPLIKNSEEDIKQIEKKYLNEIKSMISPPEIIRLVISCVYHILEETEENKLNWEVLRLYIKKDDFIQKIINYKTRIESQNLDKTLNYIQNVFNKPDFTLNKANNASKACGPLFKWVEAIFNYKKIFRQIQPMQAKVNEIENKIKTTEENIYNKEQEFCALKMDLETKNKNLQEKSDKISVLNEENENIKNSCNNFKQVSKILEQEIDKWCLYDKENFNLIHFTRKILNIDPFNGKYDLLDKIDFKEAEIFDFTFQTECIDFDEKLIFLLKLKRPIFIRNYKPDTELLKSFTILSAQSKSFITNCRNIINYKNDVLINDCDFYCKELYNLIKIQMKNKNFNIILTSESNNDFYNKECINFEFESDLYSKIMSLLFNDKLLAKLEKNIYYTEKN